MVGVFLTGWASIIAVILNYVKRSEARGTWPERDFQWQIRTCWFGLLWVALCLLVVVGRFRTRLASAERQAGNVAPRVGPSVRSGDIVEGRPR